jgi:hypothetical protein
VSHDFDTLSGFSDGAARQGIVKMTIAVSLAASAAVIASVTMAEAGSREISASSSYSFADSLLPDVGPQRPPALRVFDGGHPCSIRCGPDFGTFFVRRSDVLTSNTADVSAKTTSDGVGHPMGVGGIEVVERLEADASGAFMNWVVVSERTLDTNGSHSWSLISDGRDAPWAPSNLYRFEGSSFAVDLDGSAPPTPEASTWIMTLLGFAGVCLASRRRTRTGLSSSFKRKGAHA